MQYRTVGKSDIRLSALGFGAMRLPEDVDEAVALMQRAFELGVNYLDTAYVYPESEPKCGKALKGWRDRVYLSTKNPTHDTDVDGWWERLNTSLERLDTDYIDFYQVVHGLRWDQYGSYLLDAGGMKAVRKAQEQGMIRHVCFSCHDTPDNMVRLIDTGEFEGITLQYNLLDRNNEQVIEHAAGAGMAVIVMGPVAGGRLAAPSQQIQAMIGSPVKSSPEVALRFVLSNPHVTCAISGMSTMEMLEENAVIASREEPLSADERLRVEESMAENRRLAELYCTGCGYCQPCPNEVSIAENFRLMNLHRIYGLTEFAKRAYSRMSDPERPRRGKRAEDCIGCGECEPKCPQKIAIVRQLKEVAETLGE